MGGKHKQSQRTKNNARPSSSGRSAELLCNTSTFVGFNTAKDGNSSMLPGFSLSTSEEAELPGNSEFKLVIKKMYKKDSTTKLKALQEFADLCKRSDVNEVKGALPQWPHIYNLLAMDADHRVREASHQAQRQLAILTKKSLAPYLKALAGPWFTGQYDTYPPAATAARLAFQDAFPPSKILEAIAFCQEEIFNYIYDNLINQTASTLSNPKNSSADEMEAKHIRVLISSLQGYAFYLQQLPISILRNSEQTNKKLICSAKFWKYASNKSPLVRSAWFSALIALCQKAPFLLEDHGSQVAHAVFGNLDETDPSTLPVVWEAALHALVAIEDCWSHVDPHKIVFPKLWRVLREGGQGNAVTIFPNLLPLLSKMPSELLSYKKSFYIKFFDNMREGFTQASVQLSQSESSAVSTTFIECLRYIIMVHQDDPVFCKNIMINQLIPVLKTSFIDKKWSLCIRPLYSQISSLVNSWHKNSSESSCFKELVSNFWEQVNTLISDQIHETEDNFAFMSNNQLEFILFLKDPFRQQMKENLKVTFLEPGEKMNSTSTDNPKVSLCVNVHNEDEAEQLLTLVLRMCDEYSEMACSCNSHLFVEALSELILKFNSQELVSRLARNVNEELEDSFSLKKLLIWLHNPEMPTSKVVQVLFLLLVQLDVEEKQKILNSLYELKNPVILQWCLVDAITSHYNDTSVKAWLKSAQLSEILISIVKDILTNSFRINAANETDTFQITWDMFKCCFSKTSDGDFPVGIKTLVSILRILSDALSPRVSPHVTQADPNSSARFVGELTCALFNGESLSSVPLVLMLLGNEEGSISVQPAGSVLCDLALSLFTMCCIGHQHVSVLQTSTLSLLGSAWQALVSSIAQALMIGNSAEPFLEVTQRFANATWVSLSPFSGVASIEVAAIKAVTFMQAALVPCSADNLQLRETILASLCDVFFKYVTNSSDGIWGNWKDETVVSMCLTAEILKNSICLQKEVIVHEDDPERFLLSVSISLFTVIVLSKLQQHCECEEIEGLQEMGEDAENCNEGGPKLLELLEESSSDNSRAGPKHKHYADFLLKFLSNIVEALRMFTLCKLFLLHYKNDVLSIKINSRYKLLKAGLKNVIGSMDESGIELLRNDIISKIEKNNGLGLWTLKFLFSEILCEKEMSTIFEKLRSNPSLNPCFHVQLIQVFSPYLGKEVFEGLSSEFADNLLSECNVNEEETKSEMRIWPYGSLSIIACALCNIMEKKEAKTSKLTQLEDSVKIALDAITLKRKSGNCRMFSGNVSSWSYMEACAVMEIADFLEACVRKWRKMLSPHQWDLLLCSVVGWVQGLASIAEKHTHLGCKDQIWWHVVDHAGLVSSVFRLLATVVESIEGFVPNAEGEKVDIEAENTSRSPCLPEGLINEWRDIYAAEIYHPIIRIFSLMAESKVDRVSVWGHIEMLLFENVVRPTRVIPGDYVINCPFPCLLDYKGTAKASYLANNLSAHLLSPVVPLQTAAYHLILKLIPNLLEEDMKILSAEGSDLEKIYEKLSCYQLQDGLNEAQSVVDTMLMDFRIGDSCTVQPFTDTYTYTIAYFLYWKIILEMCRVAASELRCHYAQWLRDSGRLNSLLRNLFRLLPDHLLQGCSIKVNTASSRKFSALFESKLAAQAYYGSVTTENLERLVCWVWGDTFRYLPALVRLWWNDLESRSSALVERLTALYLSPLLCAEEMRAVQVEEKTFSNMSVRVHHTVREVVAVYKVDDAEAELLIQLPTNHPLGLVKVESVNHLFGTNQSHNWMRQITIFLNYQNGSIWDGLTLWKKNLDKRFEGVEECYICYSILHNSNYQIPKLSCQTCKKKFHSQCLYKWFSTSNNSTCPICRNLWKY